MNRSKLFPKNWRRSISLGCLLLLGTLVLQNPILPAYSDAALCRPTTPEGHGNATSEKTAKRNALISLKRNLDRKFPGDSKRYLRKGIAYKCQKSVLWLCSAKPNVCN